MLTRTDILGVGITDASEEDILEYVFSFLKNGREKGYIVTPNPEIVTHAQAHLQYREILNKATIALCDGVGLLFAAQLLGKHLSGRITGTDFIEKLCKRSVSMGVTIGFLGAGPGVALRAARCLSRKYPGLDVVFAASEWPEDLSVLDARRGKTQNNTQKDADTGFSGVPRTVQRNSAIIDVLFVAYGFPKQEEWIAKHLSHIPVRMAMGVGGAFDYLAGVVPRAPFFVRMIGLEWLFRLVVQPWRIKRQVSLLHFVWLAIKARSHSEVS